MIKNKDYFECSCGCELASIELDYDTNEVYISFWELGSKDNKTKITHKLRHIKHILKEGNPYSDQICFTADEFKRYRDFINEISLIKINGTDR